MNIITFHNGMNWAEVEGFRYDREGKCVKSAGASLSFDRDQFESLSFHDVVTGEKIGRFFPGRLAIDVEYKKIPSYETPLSFLKSSGVTGRVDTYVLQDEKNLFYRPNCSKKVNVFVPAAYDGTKPYSLLYFFDAQNLFSQAGHYTDDGDPYGGWQLDIVLQALQKQYSKDVIVVAIDNSDELRMQELLKDLTAYGSLSAFARGEVDDNKERSIYMDNLADFMRQTVHPLILEKYCVTEENMGIGGSSMGGIAAFCCALREIGVYDYVLSYSPAFGLYEKEAFKNWFDTLDFAGNWEQLPKIHIFCGAGDPLEQNLEKTARIMKEIMVEKGYDPEKIFETYDPPKKHNEETWRLMLPESFSLLFGLE